jgi:hypothetical protein
MLSSAFTGAEASGANSQEAPHGVDETEFERLRAWRRAEAEGKPAFMVAVNAVLEDVLRRRPRTIVELRAVRGIGPVFCAKHGESLLRTLGELEPSPVEKAEIGEMGSLMRLANEAIGLHVLGSAVGGTE